MGEIIMCIIFILGIFSCLRDQQKGVMRMIVVKGGDMYVRPISDYFCHSVIVELVQQLASSSRPNPS